MGHFRCSQEAVCGELALQAVARFHTWQKVAVSAMHGQTLQEYSRPVSGNYKSVSCMAPQDAVIAHRSLRPTSGPKSSEHFVHNLTERAGMQHTSIMRLQKLTVALRGQDNKGKGPARPTGASALIAAGLALPVARHMRTPASSAACSAWTDDGSTLLRLSSSVPAQRSAHERLTKYACRIVRWTWTMLSASSAHT
jgi:hypothetical protein